MTRLHRPDTVPATPDTLTAIVGQQLEAGARLAMIAAHEDEHQFRIVYVLLRPIGHRCEVTLTISHDEPWIPTLAPLSYPASRFEREIRDLYGIRPTGHPLPRRLVRHGHWPTGWYPMLRDCGPPPAFEADVGSYPFLRVGGDGVYEIPVGPIHAGLIEPGHFRFSVVGETILRLKARLWFVHRGMEKLFEGRKPAHGIALAETISGDTAIGHSLAYLMAIEDAAGIVVDETIHARRALLLELERLHNHVADLGALANDVGFSIAHTHTQRLRESLLRHNKTLTGHRLLRGALSLGDARLQRPPDLDLLRAVATEIVDITDLTLGHGVVSDRFTGTAVLPAQEAENLGALGYVARASGLPIDARADHPFIDAHPPFTPVTQTSGDVLARYMVRAREIAASVNLIEHLSSRSEGGHPSTIPDFPHGAIAGLGVVEAWRGTICHRVELGSNRTITRLKIVDPSFLNWPALPAALSDTIVPDFPLANKSFNQSYAGNDL